MKRKIWLFFLTIISISLILTSNCKEDDEPEEQITYESLTDYDGNTYKTVIIGTQTWMAENLRTTSYNDGTPIPLITHTADSPHIYTGYHWYNNDQATYGTTYGALYTEFASVHKGKLCPTGWHVPSNDEWTTLTDYLGGDSIAGGKLKEIDTTHWNSPNTSATNETGFTALPGGRGMNYDFGGIGLIGNWWSSSGGCVSCPDYYLVIHYNSSNVEIHWLNPGNLIPSFSVRCVKDSIN